MLPKRRRLRVEPLEARCMLAGDTWEGWVAASSDDAEENASGNVDLTSSDLELVTASSIQTVGMRFNGVTLPQGATIQNAYIQFQVDETSSVATSLTIQGEDADNALTFSNSPGNISSRAKTTSFASWSPVPWTAVGQAGPDQQTPNIGTVIQEIVNRPGWSSGNSLVIIVTGTGKRTAESFNGVQSAAPLLHVEYTTTGIIVNPTSGLATTEAGGTDTFTVVLGAAPTADVTIDLSSNNTSEGTVAPASLTFTSTNWDSAQTVIITGVDDAVDDGDTVYTIVTAAASSTDSSYSGLDAANVSVTNTDDDQTAGVTISQSGGSTDVTEGGATDSYDVVLNTVPAGNVDITVTPDSQSDVGSGVGTPLVLTFTPASALTPQNVTVTAADDSLNEGNHTSTISHSATSSDGNYDGIAINSVTVNITDNDGATINVLDVRVASSSDDAEQRPSGSMRLTSSDLELTLDKADQQTVGIRFTGVNVPQGASIQNAYVQFQVDETSSDPTSLTIRGQAIDDAATFTSSSGNISNRTTTSASKSWSPAPWLTTGEAGSDQQTPDISNIIQEIVNRPGWTNGNSLVVISTGTGKRVAESYDGDANGAPLLHIAYITNGSPVAADDAVGTDEETAFIGDVLAPNPTTPDSDPDGDPLTVTEVNGNAGNVGLPIVLTSGALLRVNATGALSYDPNGQFEWLGTGETASDGFNYTISDGNGGTDTGVATVTITGVNDLPEANDDGGAGFTTDKATAFTTGNVLSNDNDPDALDTLSVQGVDTSGTLGLVTDNGNGTFVYNPNGKFDVLAAGGTASDSFIYTVTDSGGATDTATVTVTVSGANSPPDVADQSFQVNENSPAGTVVGIVVATDPDAGQSLSYAITSGNTGSAFAINGSSGQIMVANSAAIDFETVSSFGLTVQVTDDGVPILSATATITIDLDNVNDPPIVEDQSFQVDENSANGTVVGTIVAMDQDAGQNRTHAITAGNTGGAFVVNGSSGVITVANTAAIVFETTPSFSLTVQVTDDGSPVQSDTAIVTIDVIPDDPLPTCGAPGNTCFAVIGDYGDAGPDEEDVANLVKSWTPDFIITTGDNNYPDGAATTIDVNIGQYYHEYIDPYPGGYGSGADINRFFPSLGNHDWHAPNAQPYLDYFTLPGNERYYDFTWGPAHFFALDSDSSEPDGNSSTSIQAQWLQSQLAASTATWKIVYMHHAPYSSSNHGSSPTRQWPFQQWGATAVLAAHDHTYERIILDGFPYFVNGLGGKSIYAFGSPIMGSEVRYNGDFGAMFVQANDSHMVFEFISRTGTVIDTYTITDSVQFPMISVTASDASASEPGADTGTLTFSRTGDVSAPLNVNYTVAGTAINGGDYFTLDGMAAFPIGTSSVVLEVTPIDDVLIEGPETVIVALSASSSYNVAAANSATITIQDDEVGSLEVVEVRVASSSDDAEQRPSGSMRLTSSDLELTLDKSNQQTVGMRFTGVNIPQGASIQNAYIQFQVDETSSEVTSLTIHGEATDDAATFISSSGNITSRTTTNASVTWSPAPWLTRGEAGPDQQTPDISSFIQETVSRPGWSSGNSLVVIISGSGKRTAESYDGDPKGSPLLHVEYTTATPLTLDSSSASVPSSPSLLKDAALAPIVDEAIRRLASTVGADVSTLLGDISVQIADLPENVLGLASANVIQIDRDAAGFGWFFDATPADDLEFTYDDNTNQLVANASSPAAGRVDLLTVVMHEFGHLLGHGHSDFYALMSPVLQLGTRRLPMPHFADFLDEREDDWYDHLFYGGIIDADQFDKLFNLLRDLDEIP